MIDLYTWTTPNGKKPAILLAELDEPYTLHKIDIGKDEQKTADYLKINPNGKIPALVDRDPDAGAVVVFESGAILQYLAEKFRRFLPSSGARRADVLSWTYWQVGGPGPMFGQLGFFHRQSPRNEGAYERYLTESKRLAGVLEARLAEQPAYICGEYSIADMMNWPWFSGMAERIPEILAETPRVRDWIARIGERPAVQAGARLDVPKKE